MLITHDMGVIAETAQRVAVMYAGRLVEIGPVRDVVQRAKHPYTHGLMGSIPVLGRGAARLSQIDGAMPRLDAIPPGCAVPSALPQGVRALPGRAARSAGDRRRQPRRLLALRRGAPRARARPMAEAPLLEVAGPRQELRRVAALARPPPRARAAPRAAGGRRRELRDPARRDLRAGRRDRAAASRRSRG